MQDKIAGFSSGQILISVLNDVFWWYFTYRKPDVSAPGVDVLSSVPFKKENNGAIRRIWDQSGFATLSGTSMAAPHVTGSIAALLDAKPSLRYQAWILKFWLLNPNTVEDLGESGIDLRYGLGRIDALAHCQQAQFFWSF
jgi:subtilisin family serine protease